MTQSLEQQLTALCEAHGLRSLSFDVSLNADGEFHFYSYAQAIVGAERFCGSTGKYDCLHVRDAVESAISNLNAKRFPAAVMDLAPMGEAA